MDKKILLITGGLGYIGSHAVVAFEQAGYKTVILDSLVNSTKEVLDGIAKVLSYTPDFHEIDIRDGTSLEKLFSTYEFDGVIHFAGLKAFGESTTYPYMYFDNNVTGTLTLLDIMDRFGVHNIVFSSSASVYDASNTPPFTEGMRLGTTNPYATSKLNIENILRDYANQKGFRSAILRYFNLVGAHPSGYLGDFPRGNHGSLSSNIFDVVFEKKLKLFIYGDDFPTPDGTAIRDYIDVVDLVQGHLLAYEWTGKDVKGSWDVWNLGTGKGTSVRELLSATEKIIEKEIPVEVIPRRSIDLATPISNPEKAKKELGWSAQTTLEESIAHSYAFLKRKRDQSDRKQKKVVHFVPYFPPHSGGLEMYAKEWAENYAKQGGEIMIATFSVGQKEKSRKENGYEVVALPAFDIIHNFPFPKFWLPSFWRGLSKVKKFHPDIVHTHTRFFLSTLLGGLFAKKNAIPWIHIEHGSGFVVTNKRLIAAMSRFYDNSLGKWSLLQADSVIAVSEACEHFVRDTFGVKNVRTIYRGIDQNFGTPKRSKKEISIGYIGRLVDLKGVDILIEAFSRVLKQKHTKIPIRLKIVGDGPERKKLEKQVEKLILRESIEFLGSRPVDYVRGEFLPSLHIFVNPSLQEGLPTTVIEALAAQCQVVATDVGGTREILRYASFTLVAPKNVRALADGLSQQIDKLATEPTHILPASLFLWEQTFREVQEMYMNYK